MKLMCFLLVFVSFHTVAEVRENIKVKHQSQTKGQYVPEVFEVQDSSPSQKQILNDNKGKGQGNSKKR